MTRIKLLQAHTHAGRGYAPGDVLDLDLLHLSEQDAAWLVSIGTAEDAATATPTPKTTATLKGA